MKDAYTHRAIGVTRLARQLSEWIEGGVSGPVCRRRCRGTHVPVDENALLLLIVPHDIAEAKVTMELLALLDGLAMT